MRQALERALALEGFAVATAPDGRAALAAVAKHPPAVIVLTKIDKLRPSERKKRIADISANMGLEEDQVIPFSAVSGGLTLTMRSK